METGDHLAKSLNDWFETDTFKKLQEEQQKSLECAVGKYYLLSEEDKLDMIQALCYIMCKAEKEGTSHRGLMDTLGVYPSGFWVTELMDVHNALYRYYDDRKDT